MSDAVTAGTPIARLLGGLLETEVAAAKNDINTA